MSASRHTGTRNWLSQARWRRMRVSPYWRMRSSPHSGRCRRSHRQGRSGSCDSRLTDATQSMSVRSRNSAGDAGALPGCARLALTSASTRRTLAYLRAASLADQGWTMSTSQTCRNSGANCASGTSSRCPVPSRRATRRPVAARAEASRACWLAARCGAQAARQRRCRAAMATLSATRPRRRALAEAGVHSQARASASISAGRRWRTWPGPRPSPRR